MVKVVSSERWAEAEEATYFDELNSKAKAILDTENIQLLTGELIDNSGRLSPITTWTATPAT